MSKIIDFKSDIDANNECMRMLANNISIIAAMCRSAGASFFNDYRVILSNQSKAKDFVNMFIAVSENIQALDRALNGAI